MSLLEDFYLDDFNTYTRTNGDTSNMNNGRTLYQDENGQVFYYSDDEQYYDSGEQYYYVDENGNAFEYYTPGEEQNDPNAQYYYVDENGNAFEYYTPGEEGQMVEEIIYYDDDAAQMPQQSFFKKEIVVNNATINTRPDQQGSTWDAKSYETDKEINRIANEGDLSYADALLEFGRRYESYEPDLSDYV